MDGPVILLLAAGASARMRGADKLLELVDGEPLLRRQARTMAGLDHRVLVTLPPGHADRRKALKNLAVTPLEVSEAGTGMAASIRAGVKAAAGAGALVLLPADMPDIEPRDMAKLLEVFAAQGADRIVRATAADGTPGHPVIFPARCFEALGRLAGDAGARGVLRGENVVEVALPGRRAVTDLDTPEDWAEWRARRKS